MGRLWALPAALLSFYANNEIAGLFIFLLIEETGIPLLIPGDTLVIAAGARPQRDLPRTLLLLLAVTLAVGLGSSLLYGVVRWGGRPLLDRYGRFLHLSEGRIATIERWFRRHGVLAIVVGRLIPGLRTPTTIMAGLSDVPYRVFVPATMLAAAIWALVYYLIGVFFAREWRAIRQVTHGGAILIGVIVAAILLVSAVGLVWWWRRRRVQARPA